MKYRELLPNEIEAYNIGYKNGSRQAVIKVLEYETPEEKMFYRQGYNAGCQDRKRHNVKTCEIGSNVSNVSNVKSYDSGVSCESCDSTIANNNTITDTIVDSKESIGGMGGKREKANETSVFHVDCQNFDEIPADILPVMKKYWTDEKIEKIRQDLAFMPSHDSCVATLLTKYDSDLLKHLEPKKKEIEISDYGEYEPLREQITKWIEYKKARKESYKTEQSLMAFAKKLFTLSGGKPDIADQIIEQSMANNWAGIFELKQNQKKDKINFLFYTGEGSFLKPDGEW